MGQAARDSQLPTIVVVKVHVAQCVERRLVCRHRGRRDVSVRLALVPSRRRAAHAARGSSERCSQAARRLRVGHGGAWGRLGTRNGHAWAMPCQLGACHIDSGPIVNGRGPRSLAAPGRLGGAAGGRGAPFGPVKAVRAAKQPAGGRVAGAVWPGLRQRGASCEAGGPEVGRGNSSKENTGQVGGRRWKCERAECRRTEPVIQAGHLRAHGPPVQARELRAAGRCWPVAACRVCTSAAVPRPAKARGRGSAMARQLVRWTMTGSYWCRSAAIPRRPLCGRSWSRHDTAAPGTAGSTLLQRGR